VWYVGETDSSAAGRGMCPEREGALIQIEVSAFSPV
jgi:hypothetical protein